MSPASCCLFLFFRPTFEEVLYEHLHGLGLPHACDAATGGRWECFDRRDVGDVNGGGRCWMNIKCFGVQHASNRWSKVVIFFSVLPCNFCKITTFLKSSQSFPHLKGWLSDHSPRTVILRDRSKEYVTVRKCSTTPERTRPQGRSFAQGRSWASQLPTACDGQGYQLPNGETLMEDLHGCPVGFAPWANELRLPGLRTGWNWAIWAALFGPGLTARFGWVR